MFAGAFYFPFIAKLEKVVVHTDRKAVIATRRVVGLACIRRPFARDAPLLGKFVFQTKATMQSHIRRGSCKADAGIRQECVERHSEFQIGAGILVGSRTMMHIGENLCAEDKSA